MVQKTRKELQRLFKSGAKPSSEDFRDFIESTLNIRDDGLKKSVGTDNPLKISAQGTKEKLLDFYAGETKTWSIDQKPSEENPGFNISNSSGSKLFISSSNGNVGIGTTTPNAKLAIRQTENEDALRVNDQNNDTTPFVINKDGNVGIGIATPNAKLAIHQTGNEDALRVNDQNNDTTPFVINKDGNVGIGIATPSEKLQVSGKVKLQQGVAVNEFSSDGTFANNSDLAVPTEKAVKTYVKTYVNSVVVINMIVMWSGKSNEIPNGWALCDGGDNRPDLRDRFIVGVGRNYAKGNTGGLKEVKLTERNMPEHTHEVIDPGHDHRLILFKHYRSFSGMTGGAKPLKENKNTAEKHYTDTQTSHTGISLGSSGTNSRYLLPLENRPPYYALAFIIYVGV